MSAIADMNQRRIDLIIQIANWTMDRDRLNSLIDPAQATVDQYDVLLADNPDPDIPPP